MWHTSMHACIHTYMHACSHTMNVCLQSCRLWYSQIMACLYVCDNGMGKHVYLCHIHMWIISSHVICAFCFRICACARVLCVWVLHTHNTHTHTHTHTQLSQHLTLRYGFKMLLHAAWCPSTTGVDTHLLPPKVAIDTLMRIREMWRRRESVGMADLNWSSWLIFVDGGGRSLWI